jgi:hypothetical protein
MDATAEVSLSMRGCDTVCTLSHTSTPCLVLCCASVKGLLLHFACSALPLHKQRPHSDMHMKPWCLSEAVLKRLLFVCVATTCRLLASQLPSYDPFHPTQPVTTSAAVLIARGGLCTQPRKAAGSSSNLRETSAGLAGSCWVSAGGLGCARPQGGGSSGSSGRSGGGWGVDAALCAVGSSWPRWAGSSWAVHMADSPALLWSADTGECECTHVVPVWSFEAA